MPTGTNEGVGQVSWTHKRPIGFTWTPKYPKEWRIYPLLWVSRPLFWSLWILGRFSFCPSRGGPLEDLSNPDPWADPESRSPLRFYDLHHKSIRAQSWEIYFWDPPRGLGNSTKPVPRSCAAPSGHRLSRSSAEFLLGSKWFQVPTPKLEPSRALEGLLFGYLGGWGVGPIYILWDPK